MNSRGFTLIEVIVSIMILSFTTISIYSIVDNNVKIRDSMIKDDRQFFSVKSALRRINLDLSRIYSPLYFQAKRLNRNASAGGFGAQANNNNNPSTTATFRATDSFPVITELNRPVPKIEHEDSFLAFLSTSNIRFYEGLKQGSLAWISYELKSNEKQGEERAFNLIRKFTATNIYQDKIDWEKQREQILLENVRSMEWTFWDRDRKKWVESLKDLPLDDRFTLRGVRLVLKWGPPEQKEPFEEVRVYRPLYPFFDAEKDQAEADAAKKPNRGGSNNSGFGNTNNSGSGNNGTGIGGP